MSKVIGIDLGTSNSRVSVLEHGKSVLIPNAEGSRTTPSVVAFTHTGERLVGQPAKHQATTNPEGTVYSIKRFFGRTWADSADERALISYRVVDNGGSALSAQIGGDAFSPQQITAIILRKLKADAEAYLGEKITKTVITCPAHFSNVQRQAIKDAGTIAGLEVLRIINSAVASALFYGTEKRHDHTVFVVDLGGGSLDVAILELGDGVFDVIAIGGNNQLGGDDFDARVMAWLVSEFKRLEHIDLPLVPVTLQRLRVASEKAKIDLSSTPCAEIYLPHITSGPDGPKHLQTTLSRARFDELTADLIEATMGPVRQSFADANMEPKAIDVVLLVGGSTRITAVQDAVRKYFGKEPDRSMNRDESDALGVAIQAGVLGGEIKDVLLLDVTPYSLGCVTVGDTTLPKQSASTISSASGNRFTRLIGRNTTIPTSTTRSFSTTSDAQSRVEIHVMEGVGEMNTDNKTLGKYQLTDIPPPSRGVSQIDVTFDIDANGILHVSVRDMTTGNELKIVNTSTGGLSKVDIERMRVETENYGEKD